MGSRATFRAAHRGEGANAYAERLASYMTDPQRVHYFTVREHGRSPSLAWIKSAIEKHQAYREALKAASEADANDNEPEFEVAPTVEAVPVQQPAPQPVEVAPVSYVFPRQLIAAVAQDFGLTYEEVTGERRFGKLMRPRQCIYAILKARGSSTVQIARLMNRADHSTIIHGVKTFHLHAERNPALRAVFDKWVAA